MNLLKLSLASALLAVGIAVTAPLSAAQIGGPVSNPRDPDGSWLGTWTAIVCYGNPGDRNVQCRTLFLNTEDLCIDTVQTYVDVGWWIVNSCGPTSP